MIEVGSVSQEIFHSLISFHIFSFCCFSKVSLDLINALIMPLRQQSSTRANSFKDLERADTMSSSSDDSTMTEIPSRGPNGTSGMMTCMRILASILSLSFMIVFMAIAGTQYRLYEHGDSKATWWMIYYSAHAIVAALCTVTLACPRCCCLTCCVEYFVRWAASLLLIWSFFWIVFAVIQYRQMAGDDFDTDLSNDTAEQREIAYELLGATLGLTSALYHRSLFCCCGKKNKNNERK